LENTVSLLVVYLLALIVGQTIAVFVGLAIERAYTPYTGLVTFIPLYFIVFWLAWRFTVRITRPRA
jgi:hypothetical protein